MRPRKRALRTHVLLIGAAAFGLSACEDEEAKMRLYQNEAACEASNADCETVTLDDGTSVAVAVVAGMVLSELIDEIGDSVEKSRKKKLGSDGGYIPPFVGVPMQSYRKAVPSYRQPGTPTYRSSNSAISRGGFGASRTSSGFRSSFGG